LADNPVYDGIAKEYQASKQLPFRLYIESHSLFRLLGDLQGKRVLDLACGEGIYTRKMKRSGARSVVGVDVSPKMIDLAVSQEQGQPLGCEYVVADAAALDRLGEFDIVVGVYLLNYARTAEELARFCERIAQNLRPGGRFVGFNDNPANQVEHYGLYGKYGFVKSSPTPRTEGDPITYRFKNPDGVEFCFDNYYLAPATYEAVFQQTGLSRFTWRRPWLAREGARDFEKGYWDVFLNHPPLIGMTARK
jgi:SAM-dependent methyltransferase